MTTTVKSEPGTFARYPKVYEHEFLKTRTLLSELTTACENKLTPGERDKLGLVLNHARASIEASADLARPETTSVMPPLHPGPAQSVWRWRIGGVGWSRYRVSHIEEGGERWVRVWKGMYFRGK